MYEVKVDGMNAMRIGVVYYVECKFIQFDLQQIERLKNRLETLLYMDFDEVFHLNAHLTKDNTLEIYISVKEYLYESSPLYKSAQMYISNEEAKKLMNYYESRLKNSRLIEFIEKELNAYDISLVVQYSGPASMLY